jgi:hypothetical protein
MSTNSVNQIIDRVNQVFERDALNADSFLKKGSSAESALLRLKWFCSRF